MFRMPSPTELLVILFIVFLLFGAKRLPKVGRSLGQGIRNFTNSLRGKSSDDESEDPSSEKKS